MANSRGRAQKGPTERSEHCDSGNASRRREEERNAGPAGLGRREEWGLPTLSPQKPHLRQGPGYSQIPFQRLIHPSLT